MTTLIKELQEIKESISLNSINAPRSVIASEFLKVKLGEENGEDFKDLVCEISILEKQREHLVFLSKYERAKEVNRLLHEVNNALGIIQALIASLNKINLKKKEQEQKKREKISKISFALKNIQNVIYQKSEKVKGVEIKKEASAIIQMLCYRFENKGLELKAFYFCDDECKAHMHEYELYQIIVNLITNAVRACQCREKALIEFYLIQAPELAHIVVKDNGAGILNTERENIFKIGYTTKKDSSNSGHGLGLIHDIGKKNGGSVHFETKENSGSKFIISIPVIGHFEDEEHRVSRVG